MHTINIFASSPEFVGELLFRGGGSEAVIDGKVDFKLL